jgi:hypothetical protein
MYYSKTCLCTRSTDVTEALGTGPCSISDVSIASLLGQGVRGTVDIVGENCQNEPEAILNLSVGIILQATV